MYQKDVVFGGEVSITLNRRLIDSNVTKIGLSQGSDYKTNHIIIAISVTKTTRIALFTESKPPEQDPRALPMSPDP